MKGQSGVLFAHALDAPGIAVYEVLDPVLLRQFPHIAKLETLLLDLGGEILVGRFLLLLFTEVRESSGVWVVVLAQRLGVVASGFALEVELRSESFGFLLELRFGEAGRGVRERFKFRGPRAGPNFFVVVHQSSGRHFFIEVADSLSQAFDDRIIDAGLFGLFECDLGLDNLAMSAQFVLPFVGLLIDGLPSTVSLRP